MNKRTLVFTAILSVVLCSCAARRPVTRDAAPISHLVLVKLKNPAHADDAYNDTFNVLNKVRTAQSLTRGFAYDTGRKEVDGDYDLALIMDFPDRAAYERYLSSIEHQQLLSVWRPHVASLRIFDIGREEVANPNVILKNSGVGGPLRRE